MHAPVPRGRNPKRLNLPEAFGIIRSLPGSGANLRALGSSRDSRRNSSPHLAPIERGFTRSTPAFRAPRLLRTRSQPTVRKARSRTRLNRSSNRRSGPWVAHRCSLVWDPQYPRSCLPATSATARRQLTGDPLAFQQLPCQLAGFLRHVPGFPRLGLLRDPPSRPGAVSRQRACPPPPKGGGEGGTRTVPTFTTPRSTGRFAGGDSEAGLMQPVVRPRGRTATYPRRTSAARRHLKAAGGAFCLQMGGGQ